MIYMRQIFIISTVHKLHPKWQCSHTFPHQVMSHHASNGDDGAYDAHHHGDGYYDGDVLHSSDHCSAYHVLSSNHDEARIPNEEVERAHKRYLASIFLSFENSSLTHRGTVSSKIRRRIILGPIVLV